MVGGGRGEPLGIALALGAAVVYSLYIVVGAKAARGVDPLATVAVICCAAAAMLAMLALARAAAFAAKPLRPGGERSGVPGGRYRPYDTSRAAGLRHCMGAGVFGLYSQSGSIAQCQHSGLRALHT